MMAPDCKYSASSFDLLFGSGLAVTSSAIPTLPSGVWRALAMPRKRSTAARLDVWARAEICTLFAQGVSVRTIAAPHTHKFAANSA